MQHRPELIRLQSKSRILELVYGEQVYLLPCEYLRVLSPSAEVQGHGPGQEVLQTGKEQVEIVAIEPVGNYAVRLIFSDAHNSGIYTWDYLFDLGQNKQQYWQQYIESLDQAGVLRMPQENDKYLSNE